MSTATKSETITAAPVAAKLPHFTISFELDGFPVVAETECRADSLPGIIEKLKAFGATPSAKTASAPPPASPSPTGKPGVLVCPVHGSPMKASRKPGSYFCPRQLDDGSYCPEKS